MVQMEVLDFQEPVPLGSEREKTKAAARACIYFRGGINIRKSFYREILSKNS